MYAVGDIALFEELHRVYVSLGRAAAAQEREGLAKGAERRQKMI